MSGHFIPTIGLEIHAELKTRTKMFCDSPNNSDEQRPNVNVCPVCMGHPGTLPTINKDAVKKVLTVGVALRGTLADAASFDRKNYFYPDIPKGYQISQYARPLVCGGSVNGIAITRVHLEEDTGTSLHERGDHSLLDFNRAGVPLMELVTEPVIHSAKEAADFARELQLLLRYLDASGARMEKGEMRVEANISVARAADIHHRGTKVEIKNLNSFKAVEKAIAYEVARQCAVLEEGGVVEQETRGWNEVKDVTFSQRKKESSHDYRYFPEPDLPELCLNRIPEFAADALRKELPELPWERRIRYQKAPGLKASDAALFAGDRALGDFFDTTTTFLVEVPEAIARAASYLSSDILGLRAAAAQIGFGSLVPESFAKLMRMAVAGEISSRGAKDILAELFAHGGAPHVIAEERGFLQKTNREELTRIVRTVIAAHPFVAADYKKGKKAALQFLVGKCMKESRGAGNPVQFQKLLHEIL